MKNYLIGLFLIISFKLYSQQVLSASPVKEHNYSYWYSFNENQQITAKNFFIKYSQELGLKGNDNFIFLKSDSDNIGIKHYHYYQTYKGIIVEGGDFLLHEKNGSLIKTNGHFYNDLNININPSITEDSAFKIIKRILFAKNHIVDTIGNILQTTKATIVIAPINGNYSTTNFRLCYKLNITSKNPYTDCNIYIDAHTGEIVNLISNINDATGTGHTLYSGSQSITTEYYNNSYRLHDVSRNIETYNATNIDTTTFPNCPYFTDNDNNWTGRYYLQQITISYVDPSWWYSIFDQNPDLYIKVYDGSGNNVYTSSYLSNTNPPLTFSNLNISLTNPPYTFEIWDYNNLSSDSYGGTYNLTINAGANFFSDNSNYGAYNIMEIGNPALDVHWGIEKTYDFYLNKFNRKSFDDSGTVIKNYVNPNLLPLSGFPDNSGAFPKSKRIYYGMGDNSFMRPVVSVDAIAHEFTHLVTAYNGHGGLNYQNESGALNESFSDIFGTAVEFYAKSSSANWTIGEDVMIPCPFMRSLSDPSSASLVFNFKNDTLDTRQPKKYLGMYWQSTTNTPDTTNDHGGVHQNSGVQNHWFYLLSQGGEGVTGIGIEQATQIAYRNLTAYIIPNSNYSDAYKGSLSATEDLFGLCSKQYLSVWQAWQAVGIGDNIISPLPIVNNISYCKNDSAISLIATGKSLKWYISATDIKSDTIAPVPNTSVVGSTSYWVTQLSASPYVCESPRAKIDVVVNAIPLAPSVNSPINYCQNVTATKLLASGNNLKWYKSGISSVASPIPSTIKVDTLIYYVSQTLNNCESPKSNIEVIIKEVPNTPSISLKNDTLFSSVSIGNQWYNQLGKITNEIDSLYKPRITGNYFVIVTKDGCSSDTSNIYSLSVGINELSNNEANITIFPNPTNDKFTIQIDNQNVSYTLEILNTIGQVVLNKKITNKVEQVDLSGQAAGVYFVKLQSVTNSFVRKVIKQ